MSTTAAPVVATVEFLVAQHVEIGDMSTFALPFGFTPAEGFITATLNFCAHYGIGDPIRIKIIPA